MVLERPIIAHPGSRFVYKGAIASLLGEGAHPWNPKALASGREVLPSRSRGGQAIFVFPDRQLVAVFTGWNDNRLGKAQPLDMLQRYILPAIR